MGKDFPRLFGRSLVIDDEETLYIVKDIDTISKFARLQLLTDYIFLTEGFEKGSEKSNRLIETVVERSKSKNSLSHIRHLKFEKYRIEIVE